MIIDENTCHVEIVPEAITCAYDHPARKKTYKWDLKMGSKELVYRNGGKDKRVYDVDSLEEFLFKVDPVGKKNMTSGHKATAYVKVRGELGAVKLCHLMINDEQIDATDTRTYKAMNEVISALSEKYNLPGGYTTSVIPKDVINKRVKGLVIVLGVILALIAMTLLSS